MHLVFFTKNEQLKEHFQKNFAPILKKEFFSDETTLKTFLKNLKVPTQVIVDKKTFSGSLQAFTNQLRFHHIILFNDSYTFEECLSMVKQGLLLINAQELMNSQWWWNRTLMQVTRKKISQLPEKAVVLVPPTSVVNLYQMIAENIGVLFFNNKQPRLLALSAQQPMADTLERLERFSIQREFQESVLVVYCAHTHLLAPYQRRYFLEKATKILPNAIFFLETDGTQNITEQTLDLMTELNFPGVYQLNHRKAEKKVYQQPSIFREEDFLQQLSELLDLEYMRYTWQPDKQNMDAFLRAKS